jgi:hypothetical protein
MAHGPLEGSVCGGPMIVVARELTEVLTPRRFWPRGLAVMALGEGGGSSGSHRQKIAWE